MKQIDNRQKKNIQSRAQRALGGFASFFKKKEKEHEHHPAEKPHSHAEEDEVKQEPAINEYHPGPKIGRNDPCSCGSGKKFKKCCLNSQK